MSFSGRTHGPSQGRFLLPLTAPDKPVDHRQTLITTPFGAICLPE